MQSLRYLQFRHAVRKSIRKQISKNKKLYHLLDQHYRDRHLRAALILGFDQACAPPKQTVDLARGFRYVLRNSIGEPITKITLQPLVKADCRNRDEEPVVIWERDHDDTPGEIILARAYRVKYGNAERYVTA